MTATATNQQGKPDGKPVHEWDRQNTSPLDLRLLKRLFRYTRPYARSRNWLTFLVVVRGLQGPILAWMLATFINALIFAADKRTVLMNAGVFFIFALFTQITLRYRTLLALQLGENVIFDLRNEVFAHLQVMPMSFYNRTKVGWIISRVTSDAEEVRLGIQDVLFVSLVGFVQMIGAAVIMAYLNWRLFLVVLGMTPVLYAMNRFFRGRLSVAFRAQKESFSRMTAVIAESVTGVRVTQGFVRQDANTAAFGELVNEHGANNIRTERLQGIFVPMLEFNTQVFIACLLLVGGWMVLHDGGETTPVTDVVEFFFLAGVFFAPVQSLGQRYTMAMSAVSAGERVFRVLDTPPEWSDAPGATDVKIEGEVEFKHLNFGYNPEKLVLRDICFVAKPGQTLALVGHTGSGKSSIINLLSKFYLPTSGEILIDGHEIRNIRGESLHRQMGIVLQVNFLFTGSVMDNIRYGKPDATDEEVREAARQLDCYDLLEDLSDGFNTEVGEGGASLSLGQRQLVCFTRAMLANPRILILDEATSAVDTMTEARVQQALKTLLQGRTSLVVAHRLSTIRHADQVLVLDHGLIVERGNHTQLLEAGGIYANLYRQFIHATEA